MRFIFCECYQHSYWLIQIKINVKLKKCKSLYIATIHHWNQLFTFVKIVWSKTIREWMEEIHWNYFLFHIDISISCRDYEGLEVDLRRCSTIYEWNSTNDLLFSWIHVPRCSRNRVCNLSLRVVNETRCEWNIREISDKDRND